MNDKLHTEMNANISEMTEGSLDDVVMNMMRMFDSFNAVQEEVDEQV